MSYLVIARKWRPRLFDEVIGQTHVTKTLKNAVSTGRVAHAYLFTGPRGVGKTTAARILARSVNCEKGPAQDPCNECALCKSITDGSSVDVIEIDGASNTGVDSVRELRESIRFVPTACRYKVYIIDEVHMLSTAAFNALLKTLEEPPPHTIFIFATTEVHKIPRTILSRCQRFDFKRIPFAEISGQLKFIASKENITAEEAVFQHIAREADGSMRDAQSLFDQVIASAGTDIKEADISEALGLMDRSILYELSEAVIGGDAPGCLAHVEKIYNFGYDLKKVCLEMLEHVRDLTTMKVTGDSALLELPDSEVGRLRELTEKVSIERLHILFSILTRGYEEISRSMTERFTLEMTLLKCATAGDIRPVAELIEEVKALKEMIEDTPGGAARIMPATGERGSTGGSSTGRSSRGSVATEDRSSPVVEKSAEASSAVSNPPPPSSTPPSGNEPGGRSSNSSASKGQLPWERGSGSATPDKSEKKTAASNISPEVKEPQPSKSSEHEGKIAPDRDALVDDAVRILGGEVLKDLRRKDV